ncbi:MAG TPA: S8/S53 family peptidase [Flavobacterium sp.]|uniref:S8/S53 family peptidase n=1 Tax=Flavobacterium sp. TaxID=239 RepID=UPI002C53E0BB|nr:S8/S53 family peptidase [Flavobacterium sp.]HSD14627.1 S8/S53 family peptidase [Flavobacterium sp.]
MKKAILLFFFFNSLLFAQNRKGEFRLAPNTQQHELYVSFDESVVFNDENYNSVLVQLPEIKLLIEEFSVQFRKGIVISDDKTDELYKAAKQNGHDGKSISKLSNILKVTIDNPSNERLMVLASRLEKSDVVTYSCLMPLQPIAPPSDIAPATPNFESFQTYLDVNPGVDMYYAWGLGLTGAGIRIRDVEYGFNKNHEELVDRNAFIAPGMNISSSATPSYTEHGTSVFGIMYADKGTYGVSGMAYDAMEMLLFPEWQQTGYNRVNAVSQAIASSAAGDVIVYEMQAYGQSGNYVPAEFDNVVWDLTKAATDAGIIIVEAAANGNQNLDSAYYASYMSRGNSGAIIVGAGTDDLAHNRISYSTYGSRVDVQGWAANVRACGNGDLIMIAGDFNQGYTNFSGTSSATPIVASCVVVLHSYYHSLTGVYMSPLQMRSLLQSTGISQGTAVAGNIGPLPNMQAAILQINQNLNVSDNEKLVFTVFPNPVNDKLKIVFPQSVGDNAKFEIFTALGQKVMDYSLQSGHNEFSVEQLPQGVYFVKVTDGKKTCSKKIIKR